MAERTIEWTGKSGKAYKHWIYNLAAASSFTRAPGNYVVARETKPDTFAPIYVGQTADLSERFDNHHKMPCMEKQGATHVCAHTSDANVSVRLAEEADLVEKWHPACND